MKTTTTIACALLLAAVPITLLADREAANRPVVHSGLNGRCYAKSVPDEWQGQKGTTSVYAVEMEADRLLCEYDWYASEFYLGGSDERTLVRFGPWHRLSGPREGHLAIGFYRDGECIREYTTGQMEAAGSGISESVSHYVVFPFSGRHGFRRLEGNDFVYEVEGVSGHLFTFDVQTGAIVEQTTEQPAGADPAKGGPVQP